MKSTTTRVFTTDDGTEFTNKSDAVAHELKLKLDATVAASGVSAPEAVVSALSVALTGEDRVAVREMLADAIKLSNTLDHKPKTGGRKKAVPATVEATDEPAGEPAAKKGKKAAEPLAA